MLTLDVPDLRKWVKGMGTCKSQGPGQLEISGDSSESLEQPLGWGHRTEDGQKAAAGREEAQATFGFLLVLGLGSDGRGPGL